jgi:hypothetical protein
VSHYWPIFLELIGKPFQRIDWIWGIVPLYFGLALNETTSARANFRTAIQTGFSFLWAAAQWVYPWFQARQENHARQEAEAMPPINLLVTVLVVTLGIMALFSGLRRRYPKYCAFLGYTRFSNYFMITIYPMQAHCFGWTWERLVAIVIFAVPIWLALHLGLMPIRNRK